MKAVVLVGLLLPAVFAGDASEEAALRASDSKLPKETNYKKYIGETNFHLPFRTRVSQSFQNGQTIHIVGKLNAEPKRVDFNFHKGMGKNADLPLHFSIRFTEGVFSSQFVYNTFKDGNWSENEQRIKNPFKPNEDFDLRVRILDGKYQVFANRADVGTFEQRMPLDGIDHVSINGDVANVRLFHYGGHVFDNPYTAKANLLPGKRLDVSGLNTGKRVNINLYRANHEFALQVSLRYNEGAVVRNAMQNNVWGKEEREGGMPLSKGEVLDVTIINEEWGYQIFLNGNRFASFAHRGSPRDVETLQVDGDVVLHSVTVNDAVGV